MQLQSTRISSLAKHQQEAVVPPQLEHIDRLTYTSWGKSLSIEEYLRRERRMRALAFSQGLRQWSLLDGTQLLASCETYEVPATHTRAGKVQTGLVHGVASVFVEEKLRGRGYASQLLSRLHEQLRSEGILGCYLFSEVDPKLYARLGYVVRPLRLTRYAAVDKSRERLPAELPWRWLSESAVPALLQQRYQTFRPSLCVQTSPQQLDWHWQRGRFYGEALSRPSSPWVGAQAGSAFALWMPIYPEQSDDPARQVGLLRVLMLCPGPQLLGPTASHDPRHPELEHVRNVLHAARAVAAELGLAHIEVWENAHNASYLRGGVRTPAEDPPMFLGLQDGIQGSDWVDYEACHWL